MDIIRHMGHPPRIPIWLRADQEVVYFLTFCVARRERVLTNPRAFAAFENAIARLTKWNVIAAVLMPDHVHLLIAPTERELPVGNASGAIKRWMRQDLNAHWEWQPGSFDRLLRSDESAEEKWQYIRQNPVRAGLVENWEDWPFRIGFDL
ncbi:MAG: transposase [Verrucomicrobiota bacterium]|nr:transposase [Verrucomicrobiota bacterium]